MRTDNMKIKQPWYGTWVASKSRCNNPNHHGYYRYGGRGIKFDIGFWAMGVLYWRDKAHLMKRHTIDRIDNDGNYTFQNCRFIENSENSSRANRGMKRTLGYKHTKEARARMSESKIGNIPWNKGKKLSAEIRMKMSESSKKTKLD